MGKTYNSWKSVNEWNIFNNPKRGKQVFTSPSGQKQRMAFKIQDDFNFIIKLFRFSDVIDQKGNITSLGMDSLIKFFNGQSDMTNVYGPFDSSFFQKKFLLYTILEDSADKDKIQFTIISRNIYPKLGPQNIMVNAMNLANLISANQPEDAEIIQNIQINREKVKDKDIEEPEKLKDDVKKEEAGGTDATEKELGNKFRYTMRSNGKLYLMEFAAGGAIDAQVIGEGHPNGAISWEGSRLMWYTDADSVDNISVYSKWIDEDIPLYTDTEINNPADKEFLSKIFTDDAFRKKVIGEYEKEFGESEVNSTTIKKMLFFKDGTPIFPEEIKQPVQSSTIDSNTEDNVVEEPKEDEDYEWVRKEETKYF
jgi:hypothetical protein